MFNDRAVDPGRAGWHSALRLNDQFTAINLKMAQAIAFQEADQFG